MRKELDARLEAARLRGDDWWGSDPSDGLNGCFLVAGPCGSKLRIIATDGTGDNAEGWEHVSVSLDGVRRCPNWIEMCCVKDWFWDDHEAVVQFHPPKDEYVNHHPFTLHLWKPRYVKVVTPPSWLVGPK
jgi:hypothetical protein